MFLFQTLDDWEFNILGVHAEDHVGWAHHSAFNGLLVLLAWTQFHADAPDRFCVAILPDHPSVKSNGLPWWNQTVTSLMGFWFAHSSNIAIIALLYVSVADPTVINAVYLIYALASLLFFPGGRFERAMLGFTVLNAFAQYVYQLVDFADPTFIGPWIGFSRPFA